MKTEKVTGIKIDAQGNVEEYTFEATFPSPRISEIEQRLQDIRMELQTTDYKAIKYAEGQYAEGLYEPVKAARAALRTEYNELEAELATL